MPLRKPKIIVAPTTAKDGKVTADEDLAEDDAVAIMLAYMANGNGDSRCRDRSRAVYWQGRYSG